MVDCLKDCDAKCCKTILGLRLVFDLTGEEVTTLRRSGTRLVWTKAVGGGYEMKNNCGGLDGNKCRWHATPLQPRCCEQNKAGGEICTRIREHVRGKRFSEVE
jgi:hypothetical protein